MTTVINNITNLNNILSTKNFIDSNKGVDLSNELSFDVIRSNMKDSLGEKNSSNLYFCSYLNFIKKSFIGSIISLPISSLLVFLLMYLCPFTEGYCFNIYAFSTIICLPFLAMFYFAAIYPVRNSCNKFPDKYYNLDIDYILPLSSDELKIFINNDPVLKKYIEKNNNIIYSQYMIDKICNKNNNYRKMFDEVDLSINSIFDYYSEYDTFKIKDIIFEEQKKVKDIVLDDNLNAYKVYYSIENGPTKNITFKYHTDDKNVFKKYISSMVNKEYERNFYIINVEKII